jgi:hypothetical protein
MPVMPRYFFQADYHGVTVVDDIGEEFSTLQKAEAHATAVASELGRNEPEEVVVLVLSERAASADPNTSVQS